jgi:hypothetical protein
MKNKLILSIVLSGVFIINVNAQKVMTFQDAERHGKSYLHLDSLYKSAVHSDIKLAVFKTKSGQDSLQKAYVLFIQDLAGYLKKNNFKWEKQIKCFNRIYFDKDGKVDYFLYNFAKDEIPAKKEAEFARLLNLFIQDHKFTLTAKEGFAQCSPIKYAD